INKVDELIKWTKLLAKPRIIDLVRNNLNSDLELLIYELSDGLRSTRKISDLLSKQTSHMTISNYWRKWNKIGIVEPSPKYAGRFVHIFTLDELGISVPPLIDKILRDEK
ncbi:MAG: hypothetical protein NWE89_10230, partial [Candidatus Bathyarchaeota archaeon]|nr:hypothetical protein [Candidatus Bathyarchaeota archaeon]